MNKFCRIFALLTLASFLMVLPAVAQRQVGSFVVAGNSAGPAIPINAGNFVGVQYFQVYWVPITTGGSCAFSFDSQAGGSWTADGAVASQDCSVAGTFTTSSALVADAIRLDSTVSGGSSARVLIYGYFTAPGSGGSFASPTFTGVPVTPTAAPGTNTTQVASTAFVAALGALKANLASPTLTGTPLAPTAAAGTNNTQIATTAFVPRVFLCGTTSTCSATAQAAPIVAFGRVTLSTGTATVTALPTFTGITTFRCTASDTTSIVTGASAVPASATSITVTGTGSDVIDYSCVGN